MFEIFPSPIRLAISAIALAAVLLVWWKYSPQPAANMPVDAQGNPINVSLIRFPEPVAETLDAHAFPIRVFLDARELDADARDPDHLAILFIGNSHTEVSPELLTHLLQTREPQRRVVMARARGEFLSNHLHRPETLALLKALPWDVVVLQAQKYSTTGTRDYPIDAALELTRIARQQGAQVILFPEWSRQEEPLEYLRINKVHQKIAQQTESPIAPIGQTWAAVQADFPQLLLHDDDGNHASLTGHLVNACVFYGMLTKSAAAPDQLPPLPGLTETQLNALAQHAWQEVQRGPVFEAPPKKK